MKMNFFVSLLLLLVSFLCIGVCKIHQELKIWSAPRNNSIYCEIPNCGEITLHTFLNGEWTSGKEITLSAEECDYEDDLSVLLCTKSGYFYPCFLYTPWGTRVTSCSDLVEGDNIFIIPEDRLYMLTSKGPGFRTEIVHIPLPTNKPILIEGITEHPRLFRIQNFISKKEATDLIEVARNFFDSSSDQAEADGRWYYHKDNHFHPVTGTIDYHRNHDVIFDYNSELALAIKRRTVELLGLYPFDETMVEGLQLSRFRPGESTSAHLDWIEPSSDSSVDYNSAYDGSNRYVTLTVILQEANVGGDLAFPLVEATATTPSSFAASKADQYICDLEEIDRDGNRHCLKRKSDKTIHTAKHKPAYSTTSQSFQTAWEVELANQCQSRFTVKPKSLEAVVYYSQKANGVPDYLSLHGECPVLDGEKWTMTLFVWNRPIPRKKYLSFESLHPGDRNNNGNNNDEYYVVSAVFEAKDLVGAKLYWEDQIWEELAPRRPIKVNTFAGHQWHVKVDNEIVKSWTIQPGKRFQRFTIRSDDLPIVFY